MRKAVTFFCIVMLGGLGAVAAAAAPKPADQPRTMDEVIDRVVTNENRANQQIKQYSPLVETYIQNLRPDKDLATSPPAINIFWGALTSPRASHWFPCRTLPARERRFSGPSATSFLSRCNSCRTASCR